MAKLRSWTIDEFKEAVRGSRSKREALTRIGLRPTGGNYKQFDKYVSELSLNISHLLGKGWNVGLQFRPKTQISITELLKKDSSFQSYKLKKRLFKEGLKKELCELCGWAEVSADGRIPVEINHINGNSSDNRLQNLEILCPNCHSLRPHYRGSKLKKISV